MNLRHVIAISALVGLLSFAHADTVNLSDGLVTRYQFDGNILDSSGNGHDLTQNQPFNYVSDRFGNANSAAQITTVGPNQPAFFGTGPNLANSSSSVSFWLRKDQDITGTWLFGLGHQLGVGGADGQDMHVALEYGNSIRYSFFYNDLDSSTSLVNHAWYNLTFTYDYSSGARQIYINGQLDKQDVLAVPFTGGTNLFLGGFAGITLDDFRFYDRALSADEAKALAHVPEAGMTTLYLLAGMMVLVGVNRAFPKRQNQV